MAFFKQIANLFKRLRKDDEKAFSELFELHFEQVFNFVMKYTKSETKSKTLVKNAFKQVWLSRHTYKSSDSFESCLAEAVESLVAEFLEEVAANEKLQYDLWLTMQKQPLLNKQQEITMAGLHNEALQHELLAKLSTIEG